jgi:hypothetical protein
LAIIARVADQVVIPDRFRGPSESANGGYACGVLARRIGATAEVNLRKPPPLDRSLAMEADGSVVKLVDGADTVADGTACEMDISVPDPPSIANARSAVDQFTGFREHPFPECFTCGPHRDHHDGLHIFPGRVHGLNMVATPWVPDPSLPAKDGLVATEVSWAALDCPTAFGCQFFSDVKPAVLVRLRAHVAKAARIGSPHIVIGWPIEKQGRKHEGGSAIFTLDGELLAYAAGLWVELKA